MPPDAARGIAATSPTSPRRPGECGVRFVHEVALYDEDDWLLYAVPHHAYCRLRNPEEAFVGEIDDALADRRACVVRAETRAEWERDGREYAVSGASLCVSGGRFRTCSCYGLSNLAGVRANERTRTLSLDWKRDLIPGLVGRLLTGAMSLVYNPPERLRFEDETTFREAESALRENLERRNTTA